MHRHAQTPTTRSGLFGWSLEPLLEYRRLGCCLLSYPLSLSLSCALSQAPYSVRQLVLATRRPRRRPLVSSWRRRVRLRTRPRPRPRRRPCSGRAGWRRGIATGRLRCRGARTRTARRPWRRRATRRTGAAACWGSTPRTRARLHWRARARVAACRTAFPGARTTAAPTAAAAATTGPRARAAALAFSKVAKVANGQRECQVGVSMSQLAQIHTIIQQQHKSGRRTVRGRASGPSSCGAPARTRHGSRGRRCARHRVPGGRRSHRAQS